jgi:hypothetical protein
MRIVKGIISAVIVCGILFFLSCEDVASAEDQLPAVTQQGNNTFGCYIDYNLFLAQTTLFGQVKPLRASYTYKENTAALPPQPAGTLMLFAIDARYSLQQAGIMGLVLPAIFKVGTYSLTSDRCAANEFCKSIYYDNASSGETYVAKSGLLVVTRLDTTSHIISGTFEFTAISDSGKEVIITDGRFDVTYPLQ